MTVKMTNNDLKKLLKLKFEFYRNSFLSSLSSEMTGRRVLYVFVCFKIICRLVNNTLTSVGYLKSSNKMLKKSTTLVFLTFLCVFHIPILHLRNIGFSWQRSDRVFLGTGSFP